MENMFIKDTCEYGRNYNIVATYKADQSKYLQAKYGLSESAANAFISSVVDHDGTAPIVMPQATWLHRGENGDRVEKRTSLNTYLQFAMRDELIMSPTMVLYKPPKKEKALQAIMMETNVEKRNVAKAELHAAIVAKNKVLAGFKKREQNTYKTKNNSLSGAQGSEHTVLFNLSAHSSLTSLCRAMTTTSNAHTERFLAGNRHYHTPSVAIANIISVVQRCNIVAVRACMSEFNLNYPTVDQVHALVLRSVEPYWIATVASEEIHTVLSGLTPDELAGYAFTSDLYAMKQVNPEFVDGFLTMLSKKVTTGDDPTDIDILKLDEETAALLGPIFLSDVKGTDFHTIVRTDPKLAGNMRRTTANIAATLDRYESYISVFLASASPPASIGEFTSSIRRVVPVSDTDSTVYTVQDYIYDRFGSYSFKQKARAYGAAVAFLNNKLTGHWLAMLSMHIGVDPKNKETLVMKNEFSFPVIFLPGTAKHYAMAIDGCEGNYYDEDELELKGVSFRSSKVPEVIRDRAKDLIVSAMTAIRNGEALDGFDILTGVADTERMIIESVSKGDPTYLGTAQVKDGETYANPEGSPYQFKPLWDAVFAPKYGVAPHPPYQTVKISLDIGNKTKINAWFDRMKDAGIAKRYREYLAVNNKKPSSYFLVPLDVVRGSGIPVELLDGINMRKLVLGLMEGHYLALNCLGMFEQTPRKTALISDHY